MFPYLIAGAIGFVVAKLFEDDKAPKYADGGELLSDEMEKHISDLNELLKNNNAGSLKFAIKSIDDVISTETSSIDSQEYKTLQKEIKKNGVVPILINESNSIIIDGNHRWKLLNKMGIKNIPVFELKANDNFWKNDDLYMEFDYQYKNETPLISINEFYADGGLIAPNGKPSNLTPEQYKLVRKPEFKAWFGDWENDPANASKVVDSNGEPLVVYHGSKSEKDFHIFNESNFIYFSNKKSYVEKHFSKNLMKYPFRLKEYFLNIRNLLNAEHFDFEARPYEQIQDLLLPTFDIDNDVEEVTKYKNEYIRFWEVLRFSKRLFSSMKQNKVFDGILFYENWNDYTTWEKIEDWSLSFVVLNSNQIKLADGTNTTFDANNPDIRFKKGGNLK